MSRLRGVAGQSIVLAAATGIAQISVAFVYLLAARALDPEEFGFVATAISLGLLAAGFVDFGSNSFWVREAAAGRLAAPRFAALRNGKFVVTIAVSILALAVLLLSESLRPFWIAVPIFVATVIAQANQAVLRASLRSDLVAWTLLVDRALVVALYAVAAVAAVQPAAGLWVSLSVGSLAGAAMSVLLCPPAMRGAFALHPVAQPYRSTGYFGLASMATTAQSLDLTIISANSGYAASGVFGAVNRWTQPLGLLVGSFAQTSAPFVARAGNWRDAWPLLRRAVWMPLTAIAACVLLAVIAPYAVGFLLGAEYAASADVLQVLALAVIPAIVAQPALAFLQALGRERAVAWVISTVVLAQLLVLALVVGEGGAVAAAWVIFSGQCAMAGGLLAVAASTRVRRNGRE